MQMCSARTVPIGGNWSKWVISPVLEWKMKGIYCSVFTQCEKCSGFGNVMLGRKYEYSVSVQRDDVAGVYGLGGVVPGLFGVPGEGAGLDGWAGGFDLCAAADWVHGGSVCCGADRRSLLSDR